MSVLRCAGKRSNTRSGDRVGEPRRLTCRRGYRSFGLRVIPQTMIQRGRPQDDVVGLVASTPDVLAQSRSAVGVREGGLRAVVAATSVASSHPPPPPPPYRPHAKGGAPRGAPPFVSSSASPRLCVRPTPSRPRRRRGR